jgi:glycerol-3-phosphate acyltransferase PlsY
MLELGAKILLSYFLGSLNGSLVLAKLTGSGDIRKEGSGNAGGTNALRTRGKAFALGVMIIDIGKGAIAAGLIPRLALPGVAEDPAVARDLLALACAAGAIVGHCYPLWFQFAGGKGAATAIGSLSALAPALVFPGALVWLGVLTTTGYVGLATILAAIALPITVVITGLSGRVHLFWFLVVLAAFVVFTHRENIRRMLRREEHRMAGAMLIRRPK